MEKYDVFISYAVEDKHTVASPIAKGLKDSGVKVYFVGDELEAGSSILDTVFHGLEQSRFCVPVLSTHYTRNWPATERNLILRREKKARKTLVFPVWSNISKDEVSRLFPELADHYAIPVNSGMDSVVAHLAEAIIRRKREDLINRWRNRILIALAIITTCILLYNVAQNTAGTPPVIHNSNPISPNN